MITLVGALGIGKTRTATELTTYAGIRSAQVLWGGARLLLVGTYRDVELSRQHPLSNTLGELTRSAEGGFQRVLLRGLAQEDVARYIELASGIPPLTGMVAAVHRQTEGNPLFVTEVVRLLVQEGS